MQSVPITTKVVSSHPTYGKVYLIQINVIKVLRDLGQGGGYLRVLWFPPPIKMYWRSRYSWNIIESGVEHHNLSSVTYNPFFPQYSTHFLSGCSIDNQILYFATKYFTQVVMFYILIILPLQFEWMNTFFTFSAQI